MVLSAPAGVPDIHARYGAPQHGPLSMGGPYTSVCTWLLETCTWEPENDILSGYYVGLYGGTPKRE